MVRIPKEALDPIFDAVFFKKNGEVGRVGPYDLDSLTPNQLLLLRTKVNAALRRRRRQFAEMDAKR